MAENVTYAVMKGFLEAFNRHDLDAIMDYFAEDCVFYMPRGARPRGDRSGGKEAGGGGVPKGLGASPGVI